MKATFKNISLRYPMRFTTKVLISALVVALIANSGYAMPLPQNDRARSAFELLLKAGAVYDRSYGFAAVRTKEYEAFETLWNAGNAAEDYALKLVSDGTPAARVYGAILLLKIDEAAARREFQKLKEEKSELMIWSGCVGRQETVGSLVRKLDRGEWVISAPMGGPIRSK
jgi:hypothetical protein